jgi:hypothetical protein
MTITRIYVITIITVMVVATTGITMMPTPAAAQQHTVHIIKDATNSYTLSGSSSHIGSFDTTYRIAGERSTVKTSEDLIISTITDDFSSSPTIGYVMATNMTTSSGGATNASTATLPNPFATPQQITERISSELRRVIAEAESGATEGQDVEIKCDFGMSLDDMRCHYIPLLEAAPGDLAATTPTNTTDTGTAGG